MKISIAAVSARWLTLAVVGLVALSGITITSASHGSYTDYYTGEFVSTLDDGNTAFSQWVHVYHAHNSSASVQLYETSQWSYLDRSDFGQELFTLDHWVENGPGYYYYDGIHAEIAASPGYSYNKRWLYGGMWVDKDGGAAYVRSTTYLGEWGVYHKVYHDVDFRDTYVCHYASGSNGYESTC